MKGLIILANGFEDSEAITTIDILKRSKLLLDIATINQNFEVESQSKLIVKANCLLKDLNLKEYDFLVIPGGKAVPTVLDKENQISDLIISFVEREKLVATICAAPSLVGKLGYFNNVPYTCFPSFEKNIVGGKYLFKRGVIKNGNFITAKAMGYTIDFALEIIEYLQGKEQRKIISKSIYGEL